jgi:hypothetical protein
MMVIRSKLLQFLILAVLSATILPTPGIFAADKVLERMPNSDALDGWKLRGPKFMSKWIVGVAAADPKDPKKLMVTKSDESAIALANTKKGGVDIYTEQTLGTALLR